MVENIDFIMNSFESKELIIVTITENELNDSYYFFDHNVNKSQNQATSINQNFVEFKLAKSKKNNDIGESEIKEILNFINKQLLEFQNMTILIIFSEYFFSRNPLSIGERNKIISILNNIFGGYKYALFLVNFLHQIDPLKTSDISRLEKYLEPICCDQKFLI